MINLESGFGPEFLSLAGIGSSGQFGVPRFAQENNTGGRDRRRYLMVLPVAQQQGRLISKAFRIGV
jgi:hypothetical protein